MVESQNLAFNRLMSTFTVYIKVQLLYNYKVRSQIRASCNTSVDILQQPVITSRYQDAFAWLATAC